MATLGDKKKWLTGALVSALFIIVLSRFVSFDQLAHAFSSLPPGHLGFAFLAFVTAGIFRAARLRLLLGKALSLSSSYGLNQVYNALTSSVPAGLGELIGAWVMKKSGDIGMWRGFGALFIARVFDVFVLMAFFLIAVTGGGARFGGYTLLFSLVASVLFIGMGLMLWPPFYALFHRLARPLFALTPAGEKVGQKLDTKLGMAEKELKAVYKESGFFLIALLSIFTQGAALVALHFIFEGIGLTFGPFMVAGLYVVYVFLQMLPIQGVAGLGTQAAWWSIAFSLAGAPAEGLVAKGVASYAINYGLTLLLMVTGLPFLLGGQKTPKTPEEAKEPPLA